MQRHGLAVHQVDPAPAKQAGEAVFRHRLGHRRDGGDDRRRVGSDDRGGGQRPCPGLRRPGSLGVVAGAAAMPQPAHQGRVPARHLHAVDADIGAASRVRGDNQRPGDQRRRLARPAPLDGEASEVDVGAGQHGLLTACVFHRARLHRHRGLEKRQHLHRLAPASGGVGLAKEGKLFPELAKRPRFAPHAPGDALDRSEEVGQNRHFEGRTVRLDGALENHRGAALGQQAGLDLGHFERGRDRGGNPNQPAFGFQPGDELAQIRVAPDGNVHGTEFRAPA